MIIKVRLVCGVGDDPFPFTCVAYDADTLRMLPNMAIGETANEAIGRMIQFLWAKSLNGKVEIHNIRHTRDSDGGPTK